MKKIQQLLCLGLLSTGTVFAADSSSYYEEVSVTRVEPIVTYVQVSRPHEECWEESVQRTRVVSSGASSMTPMLTGGILGGAIGHQFGSGSGNVIATVAGSLLGASIGYDWADEREEVQYVDYSPVRHCRVVYRNLEEQQTTGYKVYYFHNGQSFSTITDRHPGSRMKVRVDLIPTVRYPCCG